MDELMPMGIPLESVAHIIQVALAPVFLLSGIAGLLNVITIRFGRVADQFDAVNLSLGTATNDEAVRARLVRIRRRLRALDAARVFGALAGAATCLATFTLFLGALQNAGVATALFLSFGAAVLCTFGSLIGYLIEALLSAGRGVPAVQQPRG